MRTHQLPLDAFLVVLRMMQVEDVDIDEVQCILANLIYMVRTRSQKHGRSLARDTHSADPVFVSCQGHIKGYISHQHQKLVVSKQNPFPPLSSVS